MYLIRVVTFAVLILTYNSSAAQSDTTTTKQLPNKYIEQVSEKISSADKKLSKQTLRALKKFEKIETRVQRKIARKDSLFDKSAFEYSEQKLDKLTTQFVNMPDKAIDKLTGEYDAYLDTLKTTFMFLKQKGDKVISQSKLVAQKLDVATNKLNALQGKFAKAEEIKNYLRERKQQLRQQFGNLGIAKELKQLDKVTYYYNEYFKEYKAILKDRKKLESKAMALLYSTNIFKKFVEKNSLLASLFRLPNNGTIPSVTIAPPLASIQTRANVQQLMQANVAVGGPNAISQVQQQIQAGKAELGKLKDKIAKYGNAEGEMPSFKPNTQKTKSFLSRLEYGSTVQFGKANNFLPTSSDIAITLGYKLHTNGSLGIGAAYKLGLGQGLNNIKFTSEGIGLRTYIDWKLKAKFYISGGYEQNYNGSFKTIEQLKLYSAWQSSGLIGLSKKLTLKGTKSTKFQVLFDMLYNQHLPITQPFIFRTTFNLK